MNKEPNRISFGDFNIVRGVGLIYIIIGHMLSPFWQREEMYATNTSISSRIGTVTGAGLLAMFFMVSGYCFFVKKPKRCLQIQARLLLKPYITVAGSVLFFKALIRILRHKPFVAEVRDLFFTYLLCMNGEHGGFEKWGIHFHSIFIMWFLIALFISWNVYNLIEQVQNKRVKVLCIIACIMVGYVMTLFHTHWPYYAPASLIAVGYLAAGKYIREHEFLNRKMPWRYYVIMAIFLTISFLFGNIDFAFNIWTLGPIDIASAGIIGFLILKIFLIIMRLDFQGKAYSFIEYVGFDSLKIMSIHAFESKILPWAWLSAYPVITIVCRIITIFVIYIIVNYISSKTIRKKKVKITLE